MQNFYREHWLSVSLVIIAALSAVIAWWSATDAPTSSIVTIGVVDGGLILALLVRGGLEVGYRRGNQERS